MTARNMSLLIWLIATLVTASVADVGQPMTGQSAQLALVIPGQRSEAELKAAVAARPSELDPYLELASLYNASGRRDEAEGVLRQALAVHSNSGAVFSALMTLFRMPADADKMLALADEWTKAEPANQRPLMLAVQVHMSRGAQAVNDPTTAIGHFDRALRLLDDAIRQNPQDPLARGMRVAILKQKLGVTDDQAERDVLLRDLEASRKEAEQMMRSNTGRAGGMSAPPPPSEQPPSAFPNAVRVGGNIRTPVKIRDVKPQLPAVAVQARVQGVVIMEITIDESGKVAEARVLRSIPLLDQAAVDAVRLWEFTPTLLNGAAVPVIMTATVQFMLPEGR